MYSSKLVIKVYTSKNKLIKQRNQRKSTEYT